MAPDWLKERPIAHRGYHDLNVARWENTLSAFEAAAERGFAIECDVHLAADGVPVVFHDHELQRLTGRDGSVHELTSVELGRLPVGGTVDTVPSLATALDRVGGRVPLVIELKGSPGHDDGLVAAVAQVLEPYRGKVAIMSFSHALVRRFASDAPGIPGGLTAMGTEILEIESHFTMLAHGISFVSYAVADLPNPFTETVRKLHMPLITWTVRDKAAREATEKHADQMTFEGFDPGSPAQS